MTTDHIVKSFDEDLKKLDNIIAEMGGLAEVQLADAVEALIKRDTELADRVIAGDKQIDALEAELDGQATTTLALRQAMAKLPARMTALLQLVKIEGLSVREAALQTNSSESAVKVSIHRAVKLLKGVIAS